MTSRARGASNENLEPIDRVEVDPIGVVHRQIVHVVQRNVRFGEVRHYLKEPRHDVASSVKPGCVQEEPERGHLIGVCESGLVLPCASNERDSGNAEEDERPEHRRGEARDDSRGIPREGKRRFEKRWIVEPPGDGGGREQENGPIHVQTAGELHEDARRKRKITRAATRSHAGPPDGLSFTEHPEPPAVMDAGGAVGRPLSAMSKRRIASAFALHVPVDGKLEGEVRPRRGSPPGSTRTSRPDSG